MANFKLEKVNVNSWRNFILKNESNNALMDSITINILNIENDLIEIDKLATTVDEHIEFTKSNPEIQQDRVNIVDRVKNFKSYAQKMSDDFGSKAFKIFSTQQYAETAIDAYNNGRGVDSDVNNTFLKIYNGEENPNDMLSAAKIMQFTAPVVGSLLLKKLGTSSILDNLSGYAATKGFSLMTKGAFKIVTGRITQSIPENFVIVNGKKIIYNNDTGILSFWKDPGDKLTIKTKISNYIYGNDNEYIIGEVTMSSKAVLISTFAAGAIAMGERWIDHHIVDPDEGDYTSADKTYDYIDTFGHGCVALVSGFMSLGGPIGIVAGFANSFIGGKIVDSIAIHASGENIIDQWTTDGEKYVMHASGIGKENTSDVIFERIDDNFNGDYDIGNFSCATEGQRDYMLYAHTTEFLPNGSISDSKWESLKSEVKACGSAEEARNVFEHYKDSSSVSTSDGQDVSGYDSELDSAIENLESQYGFDPEKWYNFLKNQ